MAKRSDSGFTALARIAVPKKAMWVLDDPSSHRVEKCWIFESQVGDNAAATVLNEAVLRVEAARALVIFIFHHFPCAQFE